MKCQPSAIVSQNTIAAIEQLAGIAPELSKQKLKKAMKFGAVWLTRDGKTHRVRQAKKILKRGDELHLYYDESILSGDVPQATLVSDATDYSVWNKPCGMFSQGTKWGDHSSIARWIELNVFSERPSFLVHRLDRAANGLILIAHSKTMAHQLTQLFEQRKIEKRYRATVHGKFDESIKSIQEPIDEKSAKTNILAVEFDEQKKQSHLLVQIETGRKHQIRKHLSSLGHPIIGDRLYAQSDSCDDSENIQDIDLQLTAYYLSFECPIKDKLVVFEL